MQQPTCTNVRIRSTHDAHKIFFAIQRRRLFMVTRRLDVDERLALRSGCVYAWEERGPHTEITGLGIERFTEGRRWSPSRVRDEFLFYYEKYSPPQDATQTSTAEKQPPRDWDPLVKQTYSVWVDTDKGRRKWHLTAYFTQVTVDQMGTIDDIPDVGDLEVPEGLFQSTRVGKNRKSDDSQGRSSSEVSKPLTVTRTYAPFSSTHPTPKFRQSPTSQCYQPYQSVDYANVSPYDHSHSPHYFMPSAVPLAESSLPPIRDAYYEPHHRSAEPSVQIGDYGRHDVCGHRASPEYAPREEDAYHSAVGPRIAEHLTSQAYGVPASYPPLHTLTQTTSFYPSVMQPSSKTNSQSLSSHSHYAWYSSPPTQEPPAERHSAPPFPRTETPTSFPLRASYPTDHGQVSPPRSYSHMYSYHPDSNMDPLTHSNVYSHSRAHAHSRSPSRSPSPDGLTSRMLPAHGQSLSSHSCFLPSEGSSPSSSDSCTYDAEGKRTSLGPSRVDLAPLHALQRSHPYRRDPVDDRALRLLGPRSS